MRIPDLPGRSLLTETPFPTGRQGFCGGADLASRASEFPSVFLVLKRPAYPTPIEAMAKAAPPHLPDPASMPEIRRFGALRLLKIIRQTWLLLPYMMSLQEMKRK